MAGNTEALKLFLQAGMDVNAADKRGETALLNAARYNRLEAVALLLAKGADPNPRDSRFRIHRPQLGRDQRLQRYHQALVG